MPCSPPWAARSPQPCLELDDRGVLEKHQVRLIGVSTASIRKAEDRLLFRRAMEKIGLEVPDSGYASSLEEAMAIAGRLGFPLVVRPSFTLGGTGGNIVTAGMIFTGSFPWTGHQPVSRVLIEKSISGWKEFELEVMRDRRDNVVIVCTIENIDPWSPHRRLHNRGPGPDADRQGIPEASRCRGRYYAGDRG